MKYLNQLEPDALIRNFMSNPPVGFDIKQHESKTPVFKAKFNLLTTVDIALQKSIARVPLYRYWQNLLQINTHFVGTTVSEYALFSDNQDAKILASSLKETFGRKTPLLIVKDIPQHSPLLSEKENNFSNDLLNSLEAQNFISLSGQALAWVPINFSDINDYLSRLSHNRRKDMRRKLKKKSEIDINLRQTGDECFDNPETLKLYYDLYLNVYQQSEIHFDLLSESFFTTLLQDKASQGIIFTYEHEGKLIGYNICYIVDDTLIDKYIGFEYPAARQYNLYFISWFYNLEYALSQGLKTYIAGWTDPEIKAYLGAHFTFTQHAVYVRNPVLRMILRRLSKYFEGDQIALEKIAKPKKS